MKVKFASKALKAVGTKAAPIIFWAKKHAPEILVGTGAVSVLGGTALACRATIKAKDILEEPMLVGEYEKITYEDGTEEIVNENDTEKKEALKKGLKVVKEYLPAAGLIGGGVGMLVAAKSIEHRRFTAMLGAYSSLQSVFEEYRGRVIAEGGESLDYRCLNGAETAKVEKLVEQEDGKKPKKVKEEVTVFTAGENPYHRIFDDCNSQDWHRDREANLNFLQCQEKALNYVLQSKGRVFLSEVYSALGFEYNPVGQFVGWVADDIEGAGDGYISFGIDWAYERIEIDRAFDEGREPEPSLWLTFNCDGEVWSNPMNKRYDV